MNKLTAPEVAAIMLLAEMYARASAEFSAYFARTGVESPRYKSVEEKAEQALRDYVNKLA